MSLTCAICDEFTGSQQPCCAGVMCDQCRMRIVESVRASRTVVCPYCRSRTGHTGTSITYSDDYIDVPHYDDDDGYGVDDGTRYFEVYTDMYPDAPTICYLRIVCELTGRMDLATLEISNRIENFAAQMCIRTRTKIEWLNTMYSEVVRRMYGDGAIQPVDTVSQCIWTYANMVATHLHLAWS